MRTTGLALILALLMMALTGCRVSGELENQAYVLVLGLDREPGGALNLTAKVPQIGKSGDSSEASGGEYLLFTGSGDDWPQALEALEQATPRQMNLSHIEMLVVSETLARQEGFATLANRVAETPHLYTTARFVVCEGRARDFIDAQETVIGTRLSSEIDAMLDHYAEHGYIPEASFADACYAMSSFYADPVAIHGSLASEDQAAAALTRPPEMPSGEASPMAQRYSGAVLFRSGRMVGTLSPAQTALLSLIRGGRIALPVECSGKRYALTPEGAPQRHVLFEDDRLTLRVDARFSTPDDLCDADARALEAILEADMAGVIAACQSLETDPFGFAEAASGRFSTLDEWRAWRWDQRYASAAVDVRITICRS